MILLFIIVAMLGLSAFFSGSEVAFVTANRLLVKVKASRHGRAGKRVKEFLEDPAELLTTVLVGNNVALVLYSTLAALYSNAPLTQLFTNMGLSTASVEVFVPIAQTILAGFLVLLIGEILPKTILLQSAERGIFVLAAPLWLTNKLLLPLIKLAGSTSKLLARLLGAEAANDENFRRRSFQLLIQESRKTGSMGLPEGNARILSNVFNLHAKRAKDSMTPRTNIVSVSEETSLAAFRQECIRSGYSKLPVYRENINEIVGIAFAHDLFNHPMSLKDVMRPAKFVPESKLSKDLLKEFRDTNSSIVIVIDEYGGTAGLLTSEDLLEELFGDIKDEFDSDDVAIREINANTWVMSGRAEIDEINEHLDPGLPEGPYDTLAGYILERHGKIPKPQEEFCIDPYHLLIEKVTPNRIDKVRITRT